MTKPTPCPLRTHARTHISDRCEGHAHTSQNMASGHSLDAEDYSLYSSLGEEELIRMAVEQSLQEVCGGDGAPVQQLNAATATATPGLRRPPGSQGRRVVFSHGSQDQEGLFKPPTNKVSPWRSIPPPVQEQKGLLDPVWEAVSADDGTALTRLRRSGAELRAATPHGWMAVHEAAYHDKPCCLGILLQAHPDTVDARSKQNETPLYLAAYRGHVACVRILLAENATVDACRHVKETPLYKACEINNSEVASLLIARRADVNYRNIYGNMPLHEATSKGNLELVKLLVAYGAKLQFKNKFGICPFFMAAQCGCLKVVRYLVSLGVDVNSEACDGTTVLFEAAKNGHADVVEFLLSQGADPNRPTKDGLLPIHVVAANGNEGIVEQLLMPVTDERQVRRSGISPLHLASKNGHSDVLELLLSSGGLDVNATLSMDRSRLYEDCRSTPLYFAIINGDYRCAELLLEAGANPNIDLLNPLLVASRMHAYPLVRLLLNHGANVNAYIPARPTAFPATIMVCLRDLRILKLVLERGADGGACFECPFGSGEHPPLPEKLKPWEERWLNGPGNVLQFCEMVASPEINSWAGPIIDTILHFVANVRLCSRLKEQLDTFQEWTLVKDIAGCPRPLAHLCRLQIRASVGSQRVVLLEKLPLPRPLLNYLRYKDDDADSVAV
ncbi:ankyrin repeat and SOCS box protein 2-like isoform X2 [Petromyzon marinus]|uniref:Ankyrin repeat and SOCS box protein 2-like isoform X1 n=2 Tax=Petromyzon marinus TaxID=7757 RepID=A0AAJ7SS63_PETMA|nr:ankyrin repeat and SOCS box protein 2-like isoform X1 [Petromyzon marinus]